jgi:hypothetical protein
MGGFVRLKVSARHTDDEQFIQAVREELKRRPRRRAIAAGVGLALILLAMIWMCTVPMLLLDRLSQSTEDVLQPALTGGIAAGAAGAVFVLVGFRFIADWRAGAVQDRISRLLIEHHDRLAAGGGDEGPSTPQT